MAMGHERNGERKQCLAGRSRGKRSFTRRNGTGREQGSLSPMWDTVCFCGGRERRSPFTHMHDVHRSSQSARRASYSSGVQVMRSYMPASLRWREASASMSAAATETLKLWIMPYMGIYASPSTRGSSSSETPACSLPMMMAVGLVKSYSATGFASGVQLVAST